MDQTATVTPSDRVADEHTLGPWYAALRRHVAADPRLAVLAPMLAEREAWRRRPDAAHELHLAVCKAAAIDFSGRLEAALIAAIDGYLRRGLFLPAVGLRDAATA